MKTAIHWFRRDLRLTDNTALAAAAKAAEHVIPVYIQSTWSGAHRWTGSHRQEFLCGSLEALDNNLQAIGSRLFIRRGEAVELLEELVREAKAEAIFFNRDPDPFGRAMEAKLQKKASALGIELHGFKDVCLHEREEVLTGSGNPFRVFAPYAKAWLQLEKPQPLGKLQALHTPKLIKGKLPALEDWKLKSTGGIIESGERAARERLKCFLNSSIERYAEDRNLPAGRTTSRLSQDLRYGLLSIREVFARCNARAFDLPAGGRKSTHIFVNELIWREFYMRASFTCRSSGAFLKYSNTSTIRNSAE